MTVYLKRACIIGGCAFAYLQVPNLGKSPTDPEGRACADPCHGIRANCYNDFSCLSIPIYLLKTHRMDMYLPFIFYLLFILRLPFILHLPHILQLPFILHLPFISPSSPLTIFGVILLLALLRSRYLRLHFRFLLCQKRKMVLFKILGAKNILRTFCLLSAITNIIIVNDGARFLIGRLSSTCMWQS